MFSPDGCYQVEKEDALHNIATAKENSIMSNLDRTTWVKTLAQTVEPLNTAPFDYYELCSVHGRQCGFSLAEYMVHTR